MDINYAYIGGQGWNTLLLIVNGLFRQYFGIFFDDASRSDFNWINALWNEFYGGGNTIAEASKENAAKKCCSHNGNFHSTLFYLGK
jgi:hypothetical protein